MAKNTMLSLLLVSSFVTTSGFAADKQDPWVAKDPYVGKKYEKENVSLFAQGVNKLTTLAVGSVVVGYGIYYAYNNWQTAPLSLAFPGATPYTTALNFPTFSSLGHMGLSFSGTVFAGFPGTVLATYMSKKTAQGVEFVARHGWKYVAYGLDTLYYQWNHLRATHLQGTLFANHHVQYTAPEAKKEK